MTNESPGYEPVWVSAGEHMPADAQAILRTNSEARRLLIDAGIDPWHMTARIVEARAQFSSLARMDRDESRRAQGAS